MKGPPPEAKRRRMPGRRRDLKRLPPRRFLLRLQLQPDLAARREARDRVLEALQRHLAHDRDRRRVQEVGDLGARDRAADDDPALLVDDPLRRAGRVAAVERAAGVARGVGGEGLDDQAGLLALSVVWPTAATCGSVKITRGESLPSAPCESACSWPRIWSAEIRAWYLPMCVNSALPLMSPIAYSHSWPGTRLWASTWISLARLEADDLDAAVLRARLAARARRAPCRRPRSRRRSW